MRRLDERALDQRWVERGFTIVELLVVVSIIALLIGILLPAIGKARLTAKQMISQANLRQLGQAHVTYAAEWNGKHFTLVDEAIGRYGTQATTAVAYYSIQNLDLHPGIVLGWGGNEDGEIGLMGFWMNYSGNFPLLQPIDWWDYEGFGWFRLPNAKSFSQYLNGRFLDPVFYAPKDDMVWTVAEEHFDSPWEYVSSDTVGHFLWSSYCLSPAALYNPHVFQDPMTVAADGQAGWHNPWWDFGSFRVPSMSQARYSDLKTHMTEHHWLQNRRADCNLGFEEGEYGGCEPYYFNLGYESAPVTLFYDGHVGTLSVRDAIASDKRHFNQAGFGLWSRDTPFGIDGYFQDLAYDTQTAPGNGTSFHILTTNGILGRDTLGK